MPRSSWKKANPERTAAYQRAYRERTGGGTAPNRFGRWTKEEDERVLAHSIPDRDLGAAIGRSVMAIAVRRSKLKRLADSQPTPKDQE